MQLLARVFERSTSQICWETKFACLTNAVQKGIAADEKHESRKYRNKTRRKSDKINNVQRRHKNITSLDQLYFGRH